MCARLAPPNRLQGGEEKRKKKKKKIEGVKCCSKRMSCFVVYIRILKGKKNKSVALSIYLLVFFLIDLLIVAQNEFITKKMIRVEI